MPTVLVSLQNFFNKRKAAHNGPDLLARWNPSMETQVNVAPGDGEPVAGKRNTFSDGIFDWFNIRVPKNAHADPEFRDYELRWPLDLHAEGIGCTGWDWVYRCSRWVGFDFDSLTGHAAGIGVSDEDLKLVREAAKALPYVEVRMSTGGKGLHLYVLLDGIPTANHTEHAALARAVLGMMSSEVHFDFASQIDAAGGNMWIWHKKSTPENRGLALVKASTKMLAETDLPANWRDHIEVVTRRRAKVRLSGVPDDKQDPFEALASSRRIVQLDDKHKAIIEALQRSGFTTVWVHDHHLLQTHTKALQNLMDDRELGLIGFFKTISEGRDPGTANCFLFPLDHGGWRVYRFSPGINEAQTWEQDNGGWTTCDFNRAPTLKSAARAAGGLEDPDKGGYVFPSTHKAFEAAANLGQKITVPDELQGRETRLKSHKDGRLVVHVARDTTDEGMKGGWLGKKDHWVRVFGVQTEDQSSEMDASEYDSVLRQLDTPGGEDTGVWLRGKSGDWRRRSTEKVKAWLANKGHPDAEAKSIIGAAVDHAWRLVNLPFQPEYPGNRQWNLNAAQYRFQPAVLSDDEVPHHPHWDMVLGHCFADLTSALSQLQWAKDANIRKGGDYGLHWIASMMREPNQPLPYLFFYGGQNCGKSSFHEAAGLLMTNGCVSADKAVTSTSDFNGELANAILAYIEEKDISLSKGAYNRIKDWTTNPVLTIRKMRTDAYPQPNMLHFVHTSNDRSSVPIMSGDTRITMIHVMDLEYEIPKLILMEKLEEEAPHFMRTLLDLQLPPVLGRLRVPVVATYSKEQAEAMSRTPLQAFIRENCHEAPGQHILFNDFFKRYTEWLADDDHPEKAEWAGKMKIVREIPQPFLYASYGNNVRAIGNMSWEPGDKQQRPYIVVAGKLRLKDDP